MARADADERPASRRARGPRVLRALYGSGLFAIGACLGVVIGSISETPRLLLERLRGPVETIDVAAPAESAEPGAAPSLERFEELQKGIAPAPPARPTAKPEPTPPVPAVVPAPAAPAPAAPAPQVAAKPAAPKPAPAAAPPAVRAPTSGTAVVQVASHVDAKPAEELAQRLRAQGFDAYVSRPRATSGRFRVRVRPASGETPSALAKRLKSGGYDTWATSE